jgi:3-oxoacyl-[acyl-carrier-protein] synthase II
MEDVRVAVTGVGLITPLGTDVPTTWEGMMTGQSGAAPITRFDHSRLPVRIAAEVKSFDPDRYLDREEQKQMSSSVQFAVSAATQAIQDAGLGTSNGRDLERIGVIIGVGLGLHPAMEFLEGNGSRMAATSPESHFVPKVLGNMAAAQVARQWNFKGPNGCISTACCSGSHSIGDAMKLIQEGRADVMVAGGTESCLFELAMAGFSAMRCLSTRNDEPMKACRPFDATRDGFVLGEGSGVVVLERWDKARARGAPIYAELTGYGVSSSAYHITHPDPDGEGPARCMEMAFHDAGLPPVEVDYINAHGSSTEPNDRIETAAVKRVFHEHAYQLAMSSTKSMTGHLMGATGAIEAIGTILAVHHQTMPPTINYHARDPNCDLDYVPNVSRKGMIRNALTNSFGFGGTNVSLVLAHPENN